jgi:hypothetical protein
MTASDSEYWDEVSGMREQVEMPLTSSVSIWVDKDEALAYALRMREAAEAFDREFLGKERAS